MENAPENIGGQLKTQREKLGHSLTDVAQHTRIRKTYLESIENNQFSDLPGQAYVTGFVKVYARYLGLDNVALLAQLEEIRLIDKPALLKPISVAKHQSKRFSKSSQGRGWGLFVSGLLAVLLLAAAIYLLLPMFQDKDPVQLAPSQVVLENEPVQEPVQQQAKAAVDPVVEARMAEQEVPASHHEEVQVPDVIESKPSALKPLPFVSSGGSALRMLALSEGSLIIYLDDRKSHQYKLHDGLDLTWNIKARAKVELTGSGMARFWLDGQELELGEMDSFQLQTDAGD